MRSIKNSFNKIRYAIQNIRLFWCVIIGYRWWDYEYLVNIELVVLKDMAENYRENSNTECGPQTVKEIEEVIALLEKGIDDHITGPENIKQAHILIGKSIIGWWD